MVKAIQHPVLGRLIPDQFGEDLVCFRQFKELKPFWFLNSKKQLEDLEPAHRNFVKKWKQQPTELAEICRNFDVLAALQSLGVYEVGVSSSEDEQVAVPSVAQIKAWEEYTKNEKTFCENAFNALMRYFNHLRAIEPDLFLGEEDCPEKAGSIEDLQECVRFDGMNISPESTTGNSTISFGWDVDWDMEHGLQMIFHNGEVIAMGNELYSPEDICSPANFFHEILTDPEREAYDQFATQIAGSNTTET